MPPSVYTQLGAVNVISRYFRSVSTEFETQDWGTSGDLVSGFGIDFHLLPQKKS